ncbi:MAG: FmdC precursor [Cyclobacteriaceae bacterium]|nr:FmdC precursor [Cyclobacteriaceae bacterium]
MLARSLVGLFAFLSFIPFTLAQDKTSSTFGKGIRIAAKDSSFTMKFSTRIQTLYDGRLNLETNDYNDRFMTRRARLKFDGFAYSPKLVYKIELAVASSDIAGGDSNEFGNTSRIILDAVLKWNFAPNWELWFGQTKLPGNRERVISSQNLQFVDRSNVNARFNIDRDAGIQLHYGKNKFNFVSSVSLGDGRNIVSNNVGGYDYTVRGEYLPFGEFKSGGDYFSADLNREEKPKLSIGVTYDYNDRAYHEQGQLGDALPAQRDLETWFVDAHFKYNGWSSLLEYAHKTSPDGAAIFDGNGNFVDAFYTGEGISWQGGYLFKNNFELAGRYTQVSPERVTLRNDNTQYTLGVSKYFVGHSLKIQSDVTLIKEDTRDDVLMTRLQVELSF